MKRKVILILFSVVIIIVVGLVFLQRWSLHAFGRSYDPSSRQDLQKLTSIAKDSRPLRDALEQFRHDHGSYPLSATNFFQAYLHATNSPDDFSDWKGWRYVEATTNTYTIFYNPCWDDGFWYEHLATGTAKWHYSTSVTDIDLTHQLE